MQPQRKPLRYSAVQTDHAKRYALWRALLSQPLFLRSFVFGEQPKLMQRLNRLNQSLGYPSALELDDRKDFDPNAQLRLLWMGGGTEASQKQARLPLQMPPQPFLSKENQLEGHHVGQTSKQRVQQERHSKTTTARKLHFRNTYSTM